MSSLRSRLGHHESSFIFEKGQAVGKHQVVCRNAAFAICRYEEQASGTRLFAFMKCVSDVINVEISVAIADKVTQRPRLEMAEIGIGLPVSTSPNANSLLVHHSANQATIRQEPQAIRDGLNIEGCPTPRCISPQFGPLGVGQP